MELELETLDTLEAPLSADFWTGFAIGSGFVGLLGGAVLAVALAT